VASAAAPLDNIGGGSFWSGYIALSPHITPFGLLLGAPAYYGWGAQAYWPQPAGTCTSTDTAASFWAGLGKAYSNVPVERAGTDTDCSGGSPVYSAWYSTSMSSQTTFGGAVSAGDSMGASVMCYLGYCSFSVSDYTAGWNAFTSTPFDGTPPTSSEVMVSRPISGLVPLTNFGTVTFQFDELRRRGDLHLQPEPGRAHRQRQGHPPGQHQHAGQRRQPPLQRHLARRQLGATGNRPPGARAARCGIRRRRAPAPGASPRVPRGGRGRPSSVRKSAYG
jgi:hypothetical protein